MLNAICRSEIAILTILFSVVGCKDFGEYHEPYPGTWVSLGLNELETNQIVLEGNKLYVCTGEDGLWMRDLDNSLGNWNYLGLADTNGLPTYLHVVTDVDVYGDTLLAAMYHLGERVPYGDVGIWKSTDKGNSWMRSDSGIHSSDWPYSSMWAVSRAPSNPSNVIASVGWNFRSSDGGRTWAQVYPSSGRGETFRTRITWHHAGANEVWVYGQGNIFGPMLEVSRDGGLTWDDRWNNGITGLDLGGDAIILAIGFDATETGVIYLASDLGVLISRASGEDWLNQHWETPPFILTSQEGLPFRGLAAHPVISGEVYFAAGNTVYLTNNFGQSFTSKSIPNSAFAYALTYDKDLDLLIVATNAGVYGFRFKR